MRIIITMTIDPEFADEGHAMGVTEEGFERITSALIELGDNIDVSRAS